MDSQFDSVARQFGANASSYLTSETHARGDDLEYLRNLGSRQPGLCVLDLGCGAGHVSFALAPFASRVVAYDLSQAMLDVVSRAAAEKGMANIATRQGRVETLPFADAEFELVVCRYTTHHWNDVAAGLSEAYRVLRRGGRAIFIDVVSPEPALLNTHLQAVELLRDMSHARNYSADEWRHMLAGCGFVAEGFQSWKLRMEFASWVARIGTSLPRQNAIRILFDEAPSEVLAHFGVEGDHSFTVDAAMFEARRPA